MSDQDKSLEEMLAALPGFIQPKSRMVTVWKYPLHPFEQVQSLTIPQGAFLLSVGAQPWSSFLSTPVENHERWRSLGRVVYLWAMVDPSELLVSRRIVVLETGKLIRNEELAMQVGAVHLADSSGNCYTAHIFDSGVEEEL